MRNMSLNIAKAENEEDIGNDNEGQVTDESVKSVADVMRRGTSAYSYSLQAYRGTSKFTTHQVPNSLDLRLFQKPFSKGGQDSSEPSTHGYGTSFLLPTPHWLDNYNLSMKHSFEFTM